jgi:hypothetical protein
VEGERDEQREDRRKDTARRQQIDQKVDALLQPGAKSEWMERSAAAADDPVSDDEKRGLGILGGSSIRGDAIPGVSDPVRDGSAAPHERATSDDALAARSRTNPPVTEHAGTGDGGISVSGGTAGGARGNAGTSDSGAGGPLGESRGGPGEYKGTSRTDLDHPTAD